MKIKTVVLLFKFKVVLFLFWVAGSSSVFAQQNLKITGKVTDTLGIGIPSVSIVIKGTEIGTSSNQSGAFTMYAPIGSTLVFSYVGFLKREVLVSSQSTSMDIKLKPDQNELEDVVVVGYGTVKKKNLTGSVSQIKSESLENRAISTLSEAFAGQLAGVQAKQPSGAPGRELDIKVRGTHTINASNDPLYVIDGVPGNIIDVNQNDVESIEILKDASSAAIYGARGANGVVIITTKKGKIGKPVFNFKSITGAQEASKLVEMMSREEFLALNIWGRNESYLRKGGKLSDPMSMRAAADQYPDSWQNPELLPDVNWGSEVYHLAPMQQYDLSVSGGSEKVGTHYLSGSYINDQGILKNTGYNRFTLRLKSEINIGERVKLGMQISPSISKRYMPNTDGVDNIAFLSLVMPNIASLQSQTKAYGFTPGVFGFINPLERLKRIENTMRTDRVVSSVWGEANLTKTLTFKTLIGFNYVGYRGNSFIPNDLVTGNATGSFNITNLSTSSVQNTLTYKPVINKDIVVDFLLGQSIEEENSRAASGAANGYPFDLVYTLNTAASTSASSSDTQNRMASFFGRANFNIKDKYLLTLNARQDGSSKFGSDSKWGFFPSASAGWKIDQEAFMADVKWIDMLKLRVSIGKVGNNSIGNYESIARLAATNYNLNGVAVQGMSPSAAGNPDLRWETKVSKNFGLDLGLFSNRFQLGIDYYIEDTKDMLLNVPVTHMYGFSSIRQNYGEMQNRGWEFDLTSNNLDGAFKWKTSLNFSKNLNEVKKLGQNNAPMIIDTYGYTAFITKVGEPVGSFYMYKSDGLLLDKDFDATGKPIVPILAGQEKGNIKIADVNNDGVINAGDLTVQGSNQPDFTWGMTNRFEYKRFDFNVFFQGSQGGKILFLASRSLDVGQIQGMNQFSNWTRSWKPDYSTGENPVPTHLNVDMSWDGKTPNRFGNNPQYNDTWLYDASFIRLRNISVGYSFPKTFGNKMGIKGLRVYAIADNLYTWSSYKGYSPEAGNTVNGNDTTMQGIDFGSYAVARVYSFGINLTF